MPNVVSCHYHVLRTPGCHRFSIEVCPGLFNPEAWYMSLTIPFKVFSFFLRLDPANGPGRGACMKSSSGFARLDALWR